MSTTTAAASSLRQTALGDVERELAQTRRILERVPEEHFGWKPHEKSMALGSLASHVASLVHWQSTILASEELDLAAANPRPAEAPSSREELLRVFDAGVAALAGALAAASDEDLAATWTFRNGERVIMSEPRAAVIRTVGLSHIIHHRGQLSVYLRLLDIPVPGLYGPSADEPFF